MVRVVVGPQSWQVHQSKSEAVGLSLPFYDAVLKDNKLAIIYLSDTDSFGVVGKVAMFSHDFCVDRLIDFSMG
jgi:hypothetical protein